jgi:hypothetical protein
MPCRSPTNFLRWQEWSVQFEQYSAVPGEYRCLIHNPTEPPRLRGRSEALLLQGYGATGDSNKVAMDKSGANKAAMDAINAGRDVPILVRQVKYLNNIVEQNHRAIKRVTRPMLNFTSFVIRRLCTRRPRADAHGPQGPARNRRGRGHVVRGKISCPSRNGPSSLSSAVPSQGNLAV